MGNRSSAGKSGSTTTHPTPLTEEAISGALDAATGKLASLMDRLKRTTDDMNRTISEGPQ